MGYNTGVIDVAGDVHRRFRPHPSSVGDARRMVREALTRLGRDDLANTAELLVSEVVTNALVHAGTPIDVTAWVREPGLRVEVRDGSPQLPSLRHNATLAGTGRGLLLLQQMVDAWGAQRHGDGKTVWFELGSGDLEAEASEIDLTGLEAAGEGAVPVELHNVPLLLHVAWHQHAEALLREHLLLRLGDGDDDDVEGHGFDEGLDDLQAHAAASDALALLATHLPDPHVGEDADVLMAAAIEPAVSSECEVVPVPAGSLEHFRVLGALLDAALELADAGDLLTPPTQPEIREFRRWVCGEVERQATGEAPAPWVGLSGAAPPRESSTLDWATAEVTESSLALVAADDTNGIIAVSPSALELLGYDDPAQLVGRRLLAIIPDRFHQAHLAGFTLHLADGRSPLLGRPVTVPVLRRDGDETTVELTVEARRLPHTRRVFVATLRT